MSLQDKLNENRNMSELFQETKELNELMKSYIRVHMNEEMAKEVTIHNQLNQNKEKSDKNKRIEKTNNKTVKAVQEMQKSNVEELNQINNEISTSMTNIKRNLNETVKKAEQETRDLVSNAKHGALVTNIIDALKYGAATSA